MASRVDKKLDCLGLYCPEPVFRTRLVLDEMEVGETLEVLMRVDKRDVERRNRARNSTGQSRK